MPLSDAPVSVSLFVVETVLIMSCRINFVAKSNCGNVSLMFTLSVLKLL